MQEITSFPDYQNTRTNTRTNARTAYLVPVHGESLLEGELEPVTAGHTVTCPVVEVLVADHTLDAGVVQVSGGFWGGKNQPEGNMDQDNTYHIIPIMILALLV